VDDGKNKPEPEQPGKTHSPYYQANDAGGYGNPPVSGQRKKGDPGGPGRPKGQTSLEAALRRVLRKKRAVVRDGKVEKLHPSDIMAERTLEAFLAKNLSPSMIQLAHRIMERFGPQMPEEKQQKVAWGSFSDDELHLFGELLTRVSGEDPQENYVSPFGPKYDRKTEGYYCVTRRADGHIVVEKIVDTDTQSVLPPPLTT
jgi:hypothetical protein